MTIKQLTYFAKIYESGSLSKASESLFISQQALSRILNSLEHELHGQLFYRSSKGLSPTPLGIELYRSSQPLLREMTALDEHIKEFVRLSSGQLQIGLAAGTRYFNTINIRTVWSDFLRKYPQLSINAWECSYVEGLEALKDQKLDLLTFSDYDAGNGYLQYDLRTWERVLIVPRGHALYDRQLAKPDDFKGEHVVFCANPQVYRLFLDFCDDHDCHPTEIVRVSDTLYMYDACQAECCIGITIHNYFSDAFLPQFPQLKLLHFKDPFLPYTVSAISRRNHPLKKAIKELSMCLKSYLEVEASR